MATRNRPIDPTRTTTLRRRFMASLRQSYRELNQAVDRVVQEEDSFGLRPTTESGRWQFETTHQQLSQFEHWLDEQIKGLLEEVGASVEDKLWSTYIAEGYLRGAGRAFSDATKESLAEDIGDFFQGGKRQFLRDSFSQPESIGKVKLLAARTLNDFHGVNTAMATQIKRVLVDGLVTGSNPKEIAANIKDRVKKIGITRAETIARTEIVRAHAEGQLDALERMGVQSVGVLVEWSTAGDGRVCPLCRPLDGVTLKISEARGLIPRHPNCRCAFVPAGIVAPSMPHSGIRAAIDKSIRAEIPKSTSRSLRRQKRLSRWVGADARISKVRPESILG